MQITNLNLTDFSFKELNFLYITLDAKRKEYQEKIEHIEKLPPSREKYDLYTFFNEQLDYTTQWLVKADEAQKAVKAREILLNDN